MKGYIFKSILEEVIGDALPVGRVYLSSNFKSVNEDILARAKRFSIKTIIADKPGGDMQIHFSFEDHTSLGLDF